MSGPVRCPGCQSPAAEAARFCSECGTPLTRPERVSDSRKIVTVLFIDLVGSTELAETLDPEALRLTMDRYYSACTRPSPNAGVSSRNSSATR